MTTTHRLLSAAVLMVWGSVLCFTYFSGKVDAYLHPSFRIFTVLAGGVLVLLAFLLLFLPADEKADTSGCANSMVKSLPGHVLASLILVVPLLVAAASSPDQFGASTVLNRGFIDDVSQLPGVVANVAEPALPGEDPSAVDSSFGANEYLTKNAKGEIIAEVIDLLYAAQEPTMLPDFENKKIEMVGQLMPAKENNPNGDRINLVRMFMVCCAADARPAAVTVQPAHPVDLPEMTWVKVSGTATFPLVDGNRIPLVEATDVEKTDPPEELFLY